MAETRAANGQQNKSSQKTYTLVELVHRAPALMVGRGPEGTVFSFPVLALIEGLLALGVILFLLAVSLLVNAPLEEIANPNQTTDPAKAPWYFMGLQEMLEHGHPTLMAVALPTLIVLFVIAIPYIDNSRRGAGVWFTSPRGKRLALYTALYALIVMPAFIVLDNLFPPRELLRGLAPEWVSQVAIPGGVMALIVLMPLLALVRLPTFRQHKPNAREVVLVLFTLLFVSAIVFTLTGFLLRGPGFELYLPWNMPGGYNPFHHL